MQDDDYARYLSERWNLNRIPTIGDGKQPEKNFLLLIWFVERYRYENHELAQLMAVDVRSVYRWRQRRSFPRMAAFTLLALVGTRKAQLNRRQP